MQELVANAQVLVATNNSEYQLVRPAASYKKIYNDTLEQAEILYEVCYLTDLLGLRRMALTSPLGCSCRVRHAP